MKGVGEGGMLSRLVIPKVFARRFFRSSLLIESLQTYPIFLSGGVLSHPRGK